MSSLFRGAIVVLLFSCFVPSAFPQGWTGTNPLTTTSKVEIGTGTPDSNFGLNVIGSSYGLNVDTSCCGFVFFKKSGALFGWQSHDGGSGFTLTAAAGKSLLLGAGGTDAYLAIGPTGNIGIGIASPAATKLYVNATGTTGIGITSSVTRTSGTAAVYGSQFLSAQGSTAALPLAIGLTVGTWRTDAAATGLVTDSVALAIGSSADPTYGISATNNYGIRINDMNNPNAQNNYALFYNYVTSPFVVTAAGDVGIGVPSPQAKLDVLGSINVSGNINAKYQDVAEWVPASADLAPGTVVVLDQRTANTVRASEREYDESVAGVVSPQPGLLLGEAGASKEMIATTGRVRARVDATRGPIRIGDLLVTSDKPGFAMRSQPIDVSGVRIHRPGTVIGKALEPLSEGQGEILVLLSLQ